MEPQGKIVYVENDKFAFFASNEFIESVEFSPNLDFVIVKYTKGYMDLLPVNTCLCIRIEKE